MKEHHLIQLGYHTEAIQNFNPSQLGVSSRQINYWIEHGLLPFFQMQTLEQEDKSTKRQWVRLSLTQAVWACVVKEVLKFGSTVAQVQELAYEIWQRPREEHYADKIITYHIEKNPGKLEKKDIDILKSKLKDDNLMEHYLRIIINPFSDAIKSAVLRQKLPHSFLYVPETNDYKIRYADNSLIMDLGSQFLEHTMLSIPISHIISKVISAEFYDTKRKDLSYLNEVERQIRDIVVFKKPKKVVIAFDNDNIRPITVTEKHKTREELARYILDNKIKKGSKLLIDIRPTGNYEITLIQKHL